MFDTSKEIAVKIFSGAVKECVVRWPSDQEWIANASKRRLLGRATKDGTVYTSRHIAANGELARRIRIRGDELDDAEGAEVIRKLAHCIIPEGAISAEYCGTTTRVMFIATLPHRHQVSHIFSTPSQKQYQEYIDERTKSSFKQQESQSFVNLPSSGALFDELILSSEGYAGAVPIIHKDYAMQLVMDKFAEEVAKLDEEPEQSDPEASAPAEGESG